MEEGRATARPLTFGARRCALTGSAGRRRTSSRPWARLSRRSCADGSPGPAVFSCD